MRFISNKFNIFGFYCIKVVLYFFGKFIGEIFFKLIGIFSRTIEFYSVIGVYIIELN